MLILVTKRKQIRIPHTQKGVFIVLNFQLENTRKLLKFNSEMLSHIS